MRGHGSQDSIQTSTRDPRPNESVPLMITNQIGGGNTKARDPNSTRQDSNPSLPPPKAPGPVNTPLFFRIDPGKPVRDKRFEKNSKAYRINRPGNTFQTASQPKCRRAATPSSKRTPREGNGGNRRERRDRRREMRKEKKRELPRTLPERNFRRTKSHRHRHRPRNKTTTDKGNNNKTSLPQTGRHHRRATGRPCRAALPGQQHQHQPGGPRLPDAVGTGGTSPAATGVLPGTTLPTITTNFSRGCTTTMRRI